MSHEHNSTFQQTLLEYIEKFHEENVAFRHSIKDQNDMFQKTMNDYMEKSQDQNSSAQNTVLKYILLYKNFSGRFLYSSKSVHSC